MSRDRHYWFMVFGVVREWHDEEGWGVLDCEDTPGGCWAHFSALRMAGYRRAEAGQRVAFTYEPGEQDGFNFRALDVTVEDVPGDADQPPDESGSAHGSQLTINRD